MNIVTNAILEKDEEDFLMNYISLGKAARNEFYESRWKVTHRLKKQLS